MNELQNLIKMKSILFGITLLGAIVFFSSSVFSQSNFTTTFGGENNEEGLMVRQTFNGGYIIIGNTYSYGAGNSDLWLIRTDIAGDTLWTRTFGGFNNENGTDVQQTTDNGFIITGMTASYNSGNFDVWLIKTDINGDLLWSKTYGGLNNDFGNTVIQTDDGGYVVVGSTESYGAGTSDFWMLKTNSVGDSLWSKTYGGPYNDIAFQAQETTDGGFVLTGYTQPSGFLNADIWLIKTDNVGEILWSQTYGGALNELAYSVEQTYDEGYIIAGYTMSYGAGGMDMWLVKTDLYGDTIWTKTFGGASNDVGHCVIETVEGDFIVCGHNFSISPMGDPELWLVKTDVSGDTLWTKTYGGENTDIGFSINETFDGGLIVSGFTNSYGAGGTDVWLLHLNFDGQTGIDVPGSANLLKYRLEQNVPNPFSLETTLSYSIPNSGHVSLTIYDLSGRLLANLVNEHKSAGSHAAVYDGNGLKEGVYIYRLRSGTFEQNKKFILAR